MSAFTPVALIFTLISAAIQFVIIYSAVRLALKHDRDRANRGG